MTRLVAIAAMLFLAAGCLPTRHGYEFESRPNGEDSGPDGKDADDDGGTDDDGGADPDTGPQQDMTPDVTPDMAPDMPPDMAPDMPPDMAPDMPPDMAPDMTPDVCVPESTQMFCDRLGAECGLLSANDNCGDLRTENCGGCVGDGVGCNLENTCVEVDCADDTDNDGANGTDCDDPNCLGQQCGPSPNQMCLANGQCM